MLLTSNDFSVLFDNLIDFRMKVNALRYSIANDLFILPAAALLICFNDNNFSRQLRLFLFVFFTRVFFNGD